MALGIEELRLFAAESISFSAPLSQQFYLLRSWLLHFLDIQELVTFPPFGTSCATPVALVQALERIEYQHPPADAVGKKIARYIASIIDDGFTLQIGIGQVPNEALKYLVDRQDLDIHTDLIRKSATAGDATCLLLKG